ncbi:MAG: lamin tail domain-containing protein [Patescibacteria group bacterium]
MRKNILFIFGLMVIVLVAIWGVLDLGEARASAADHLLISEIYYDTAGSDADEEWLEIYNPTDNQIEISNYKIGDEETQSGSEGMYQFPDGTFIDAQTTAVIAKSANGFYELYGKYPDYEITNTDDDESDFSETKDMVKYSSWASGSLSLTNNGDEVLLLNASDEVVEAIVYESGIYSNIVSHPGVSSGSSLGRAPINADTDDCSIDFKEETLPNPGSDWIYEGNDYYNAVGSEGNDSSSSNGTYWQAKVTNDSTGYMFYGPYTADQEPGLYQASFRLRTADNVTTNNIVQIDARNQDGGGVWATKDIKGTDFATAGQWQNFSLWFTRTNEGNMEYRVWFYDAVDIDFDNVMITKVDRLIYEGEDLNHNTGQLVSDDTYSNNGAWQAGGSDAINHMVFGPYQDLAAGDYKIKVIGKINDNTITNEVIKFDINNIFGTDEYKYLDLKGTDFAGNDTYQAFNLYFSRQDAGLLEYRVFYSGAGTITVDNILVIKQDEMQYEAENMFQATGQIVGDVTATANKAVQALTNDHSQGWMVYGPYTQDQSSGNYQACFYLKVNDNSSSAPVMRINAYNSGGTGLEIDRDIAGGEFLGTNEWQEFCLPFTRTANGTMEYRVWFYDVTDVVVDNVIINKV